MRISDWSSDVCSSDLRACPGQLCVIHRLPSDAPPVCSSTSTPPSASTNCGRLPKKGLPALPGCIACAPGRVVIIIPPVSVCHQVSTPGKIGRDTSELQSLMRISYAVFFLNKKQHALTIQSH